MKDFLPLLIIIGIIVFKFVKARQEQQQQQQADHEIESAERPYAEKGVSPIPERRKRLSDIPRIPLSNRPERVPLATDNPTNILHPSAHSTMHCATKKEEHSSELSAECENKYTIESLEQAKRAFVYSEIFTRKY